MDQKGNSRLNEQSKRTKQFLVLILLLFVVSIGFIGFLFLENVKNKEEISYQKEQLQLKTDSLEAALKQNIKLNSYTEEWLYRVLISRLYSESKLERLSAVQDFLKYYSDDSYAIGKIVAIGIDKIENPKGTINTLFLLNRIESSELKKVEANIRIFLKRLDNYPERQEAKSLSLELENKLG